MISCWIIFVIKLNEGEKDGGDTEYIKKIKMIAKKGMWIKEGYDIIPIV